MHYNDVYLTGTGVCLADRVPLSHAASGTELTRLLETGISAVCVESQRSPVELAAAAAQTACQHRPPDGLRALLHTFTWFQGAPMWTAAQYVAHAIGADACPAYDLSQTCNGSLAALELAAGMVQSDGGSVLVTTGDRFAAPGFDRWRADSTAVFGDAGTAVLVGRSVGQVRLLSTSTVVDNSLEGEARGSGFEATPSPVPPDFDRKREDYLEHGVALGPHLDRMGAVVLRCLDSVLADGGTRLADVDWFVPLVSTYPLLQGQLSFLLHADESATTWKFGATTGHLGAGDQFAGLDHLLRSGAATSGQRVLLVGGGTGFACTCVLVEVTSS